MNSEILNTEIQAFIDQNLNKDMSKILLKGTSFSNVTTTEIVEQIEAKLKCKKKLPTWFSSEKIYYPNKLNIEQTSSEITANYKSQLISGKSIIDLTGGFGVDSYYFSKYFENVVHCEIDENLSQIVQHNYQQLGSYKITTIPKNGLDYLITNNKSYDWIYVDPSRRHESKGKVFFLKDCLPDVPNNLKTLFNYAKNIAIKTSPLLDLSIGIKELKHVKHIHVIAIKNEVKELIWILEKDFKNDITINTANLVDGKKELFSYKLSSEISAPINYALPSNYLYEPNSAILKSGGFKSVSNVYNLNKLHQNSHLYTSKEIIEFPGRCFKIDKVLDYNKKNIKPLANSKANITTRNFSETVQQLRKKYSIKDGGETYIFFTTNYLNNKIVIICTKLS
ncbi:THUMP-like domain-containing protein [Psychroserpens sp. Hel_I_66]|uniref:THUMP-like domain-containing protein n=1 Tax=Psychroserpens sp. Hel_I_66 TaxID=1250004 RepID=UPI00064659C2|nr:SAM-dependent methyltransferase [Psychroserpens sp. Hel_I_66]